MESDFCYPIVSPLKEQRMVEMADSSRGFPLAIPSGERPRYSGPTFRSLKYITRLRFCDPEPHSIAAAGRKLVIR